MADSESKQGWLGAATPFYATWMKVLCVIGIISTTMIEVHSRQLMDGLRLSEPIAGIMSYVSFASVSLLFAGAVLRVMFWANDHWRRRGT